MASLRRDDIDRYFDYRVYPPQRILYVGDGDGEVDSNMHELFIKGLTLLDGCSASPITIYLNTIGGDWHCGMGMYDAIKACRSHVTIIVLGYAASMGSLILQAGDNRVLGVHSVLMIHDGSEHLESDCKSVEAWVDYGKITRKLAYQVYLDKMRIKKPKFTLKQVEALCSHDQIFTPRKAIEYGLADRVLEKISE